MISTETNTKKFFLIIFLIIVLCTSVIIFYSMDKPGKIVLMYHSVLETPYNDYIDLFIKPSEFKKQLIFLSESNVETAFLDEYDSDNRYVYITFDDGYEDNYFNVFPLIKIYNIKITIFLIASEIGKSGYLNDMQIAEMAASGLVSFQSHTVSHVDLTSLDGEQVKKELAESKKIIENLTGEPVYAVSYPFGKFNDTVVKSASELYSFGVTTQKPNVFTDRTNMMLIPRIGVPRMLDIGKFKNIVK